MDYGLTGKAAIVTGAAGGIGLACCRALVGEGASVVVADLDGQQRRRGLATSARPASASERMFRRVKDAQRLVDAAVSTFGRLDVLVTCAGVFQGDSH